MFCVGCDVEGAGICVGVSGVCVVFCEVVCVLFVAVVVSSSVSMSAPSVKKFAVCVGLYVGVMILRVVEGVADSVFVVVWASAVCGTVGVTVDVTVAATEVEAVGLATEEYETPGTGVALTTASTRALASL